MDNDAVRCGVYGAFGDRHASAPLDVDEALRKAYDPYAFMRNAYLQRREYLVNDGEVPEESIEEPLEEPGSAVERRQVRAWRPDSASTSLISRQARTVSPDTW